MTPDELDQQIANLPEKLTWGTSLTESGDEQVADIKKRIQQLTAKIDAWYKHENYQMKISDILLESIESIHTLPRQ